MIAARRHAERHSQVTSGRRRNREVIRNLRGEIVHLVPSRLIHRPRRATESWQGASLRARRREGMTSLSLFSRLAPFKYRTAATLASSSFFEGKIRAPLLFNIHHDNLAFGGH